MFCPLYGYSTVEELWEVDNPVRDVDDIAVPLLCVNSLDDPTSSPADIPMELFSCYPNFLLAVTDRGGHCGFFEDFPPKSWANTVCLDYIEAVIEFTEKCSPHQHQKQQQQHHHHHQSQQQHLRRHYSASGGNNKITKTSSVNTSCESVNKMATAPVVGGKNTCNTGRNRGLSGTFKKRGVHRFTIWNTQYQCFVLCCLHCQKYYARFRLGVSVIYAFKTRLDLVSDPTTLADRSRRQSYAHWLAQHTRSISRHVTTCFFFKKKLRLKNNLIFIWSTSFYKGDP